MPNQFAIDYIAFPKRHARSFTRLAADSTEAEDQLMELLVARARIIAIRCDDVPLPRPDFDQLLKLSAERVSAELLGDALQIDAAEIKARFGYVA